MSGAASTARTPGRGTSGGGDGPPYVDNLLTALTLEEKLALLEGVDGWRTHAVPRLGVRSLLITDGPHGLRLARQVGGGFDIADNEPTTAFPTSVALASTWNPDLARRMGEAIGRECRDAGVDVLLGPGINIKRSPLCGRNFEYYSEDPLLAGAVGASFVSGLQGVGVAACVKHFAANSNEDYRFVGDSLVDERALREIYLRAFERVVTQAQPETVMSSYNAINGTPASEHRDLLTRILRGEWGFDGLVMTDWGGTRDRVAAVRAGCDLDMPGEVAHNREALRQAVESGQLSPEDLDRAVARVLTLAARPQPDGPTSDPACHAALAEEIAREAATLLLNDGSLPLDPSASGLLVVGEMFERLRFQGAGSSLINPTEVVSAKDAFDRRGVAYRYERGYRSLDTAGDPALVDAAVRAARDAKTVVVFAGLTDLDESEGYDRTTLALAANQTALVEALLGTGTPVVLVLFAGAPVELPFADRLAAVLRGYV
ncbi:MAG TPA: glycoside hydrolase family 3 protein, partial [Propionibacteriaceae bacterium]|nr:glycoside hydrolase family 3 protein [Propionibacteriaceae bacterium]